MDSMYGGMLPGVEMSDSPPEGMPDTTDLISTALTHSDEHLQYDQPQGDTRSEYFQQEFPNGQPDITPQQVVKEQDYQQETTDADFWYVPENLPPQQQLQVLSDKFNQVREYMQSDVYAQEIEAYKSQRINEMEQELADFGIAYRALQSNPKDFMAQYLPEVLVEYGISPVLSNEQIAQNVQSQLQQMYGEDYQQRVDAAEMFTPGSFTSLVYQQQQALYQKYQQQNAQNESLMQSWGERVANGEINSQAQQQGFEALPIESQASALVQEYEQNWKQAGYTEDEFAEFVANAQQTNMGMQEVHKVVYFNDYLSAAYRQGLEQGKQAFYQQVQRTGNASPVQRQQAQQAPQYERNDNEELVAAMRILSQGGIPAY